MSGAAGSTEAIDQTIRGLTEFLLIVLEDEVNQSGLNMSLDDISTLQRSNDKSSQMFLEALRHLPNRALEAQSSDQVDGIVATKFQEKNSSDSLKEVRSLRVHRTKEWIEKTSVHVDKLLSATFPYVWLFTGNSTPYVYSSFDVSVKLIYVLSRLGC